MMESTVVTDEFPFSFFFVSEGEGVYRNRYVSRGTVGDDVRGDMVEAMVREVIKEKVAEALMKDPQNNEEMITWYIKSKCISMFTCVP